MPGLRTSFKQALQRLTKASTGETESDTAETSVGSESGAGSARSRRSSSFSSVFSVFRHGSYPCLETQLLMLDDLAGPRVIGTTRSLPAKELAGKTLFIFDWDDTLFPSSWAKRERLESASTPSAEQAAALAALAEEVAQTLEQAQALGEVMLVTNSKPESFQWRCEKLFPRLLPLIAQMRVVYARDEQSKGRRPSSTCAKQRAFAREADRCALLGISNIVSIGDDVHERTAALAIGAKSRCVIKSVKLTERPSLLCLSRSHAALRAHMTTVCSHAGDLDLAVYADETTSSLVTYSGYYAYWRRTLGFRTSHRPDPIVTPSSKYDGAVEI